MNSRILDLFANLYSVRKFTGTIVESCRQGEAVLVLLPVWLEEIEAWHVLRQAFIQHGIAVVEAGVDRDKNPFCLLFETVFQTPAPNAEESFERLVAEKWPSGKEVIYLKGLSARSDDVARWYEAAHELTRRLAEKPHSTRQTQSIVFFNHLNQDNPKAIQSDLPLRVTWWFGLPSALDFRLLCREVLAGMERFDAVERHWLEAMIPVLAAGDFTTIEEIVTALEEDDDNDLELLLNNFSRSRNWSETRLLEKNAELLFETPATMEWELGPHEAPPNIQLWAIGALYATPEEGVRLHPAAVRVLAARYANLGSGKSNYRVNHLVWQVQNGLCYGLLNEARLILNGVIEDVEGPEWTRRIALPDDRTSDDLDKSNLNCEIGRLRNLLDSGRLPSFRSLREPVGAINDVRKSLAHYRPLKLKELRKFLEVLRSLPEALQHVREEHARANGPNKTESGN